MTRQRPERHINTEKCCNELLCCCMPCISIFMIGETFCKGMFLGALWLCSCQCFKSKTPRREVRPIITQHEINQMEADVEEIEGIEEIEFVDFSEETKEASDV